MTDKNVNLTDDIMKAAADLQLALLNTDIPDNVNSLILEYLTGALEAIADADQVLHGLPWYD